MMTWRVLGQEVGGRVAKEMELQGGSRHIAFGM